MRGKQYNKLCHSSKGIKQKKKKKQKKQNKEKQTEFIKKIGKGRETSSK